MKRTFALLSFLLVFSGRVLFPAPEDSSAAAVSIDLTTAYELSVRNSLALRIARYELLAAERKYNLDAWSYVPSLDLNMSDSRTVRYNNIDSGSINFTSTLNLPVAQGGRRIMQKQLEGIALEIQNTTLQNSVDELKDTCFTIFNETNVLGLKLSVLQEIYTITEHHYRIAEKEYELGTIREIDLVETELNVASLAQNIFSTETELLSKRYELKNLLGFELAMQLNLVSSLDEDYLGINLPRSSQALKEASQRHNFQLQQSRFEVEQNRINNRKADSVWLPDINLQAAAQLSGENYPLQEPNYGLKAIFEFPFQLMPVSFSVGISTTPDIEYGRAYSAHTASPETLDPIIDRQLTRLALTQALEENKRLEKDIQFSLEQALLEHQRLRKEQTLIQKKRNLQERKVRILGKQLELGQVTRLDYLEGENDLLNTRLDLLSGVLSLIMAEREIEKTAGLSPGELINYEVDTEL